MNEYFTVKDALIHLKMNGVDWTEVYFRSLIGLGKVKSEKLFSSRVVKASELSKIIKRKKV